MINQLNSSPERTKSFSNDTSKYLMNHENRVRRLLEMHGRGRNIQVRRNHLRNELQAVEKCLESLKGQIQSHEEYEQLTFKR